MAEKIGKPLFCAFNRRFDPSYSEVRDRVRRGEVGHVHTIKTVSRDCPLPTIEYLKLSGGIFHDCLVHDIDMITWVLGEYPDKISALVDANIPEIKAIGDFDTVAVTLHFPSGTIGMIDLSRNSTYGYDQRLEVFGPRGVVQAENEQPNSVRRQYDLQGSVTAPIWYSFASRFMNGYRREFDHFVDVVHGKAKSLVRFKEILAVSKIATACEESARTGKIMDLNWAKGELPDVQ
ncbi:putative oxidoreductase yrbe-like protein [Lasius niger]|uniref:Putative oxidoreductase yrbe-like protein n=1 Tax=Lasius niger TaxID=67767 RepID=A0A0J7KD70_LASNI|nr:putative oxidoreductase yrbe-like protein [Lasius niger]